MIRSLRQSLTLLILAPIILDLYTLSALSPSTPLVCLVPPKMGKRSLPHLFRWMQNTLTGLFDPLSYVARQLQLAKFASTVKCKKKLGMLV